MKCNNCGEKLPEESVFCPYCGAKIEITEQKAAVEQIDSETVISDKERADITNSQRYFDPDYGYSIDNPMVVSSIHMMGYYLFAFRTKDGRDFTWKRGNSTGIKHVDEYSLYLDGEPYKTIYFNYAGNDTGHIPQDLLLDKGSFDAAKRGLTKEEYFAELEEKRIALEEAKKAEAEAKRIAEEEAEIARQKEKEAEERALYEKEEKQRLRNEKKTKRAQRWKKTRKILLIVLAVLVVGCIFIIGGYFTAKMFRYYSAVKAMENKDYVTAISGFEAMDGFIDSEDKTLECQYLLGLELFDKEEYDNAKDRFERALPYKDSKFYIKRCLYYAAKTHFEKSDFIKAYSYYENFNRQMKFLGLDAEFDTGFFEDLKFGYAKTLIEKKDADYDEVSEAVRILKAMESTDEIKKLIDEAVLWMKQYKYDEAVECVSGALIKDYKKAVEIFTSIIDFSDARQKRLEAMYGYVTMPGYYNNTNTTTHEYLKELKSVNYKDSAKLFKELYAWKVELVAANCDEDDYTTKLSAVSRDCTYFHMQFKLSGGEPGAKVTLTHTTIYPNGETYVSDWDWENLSRWEKFGLERRGGFYANPDYGQVGFYKTKIYNKSTGELIDEFTVKIVK